MMLAPGLKDLFLHATYDYPLLARTAVKLPSFGLYTKQVVPKFSSFAIDKLRQNWSNECPFRLRTGCLCEN